MPAMKCRMLQHGTANASLEEGDVIWVASPPAIDVRHRPSDSRPSDSARPFHGRTFHGWTFHGCHSVLKVVQRLRCRRWGLGAVLRRLLGLKPCLYSKSYSDTTARTCNMFCKIQKHDAIDFRCHETRMYSRFGHMNNYEQTTRLRIHGDSQIRNGYSCRSLTHCSFDPEKSS